MSFAAFLKRAETRGFGPRVLVLLAFGFLLLLAINGVSLWASGLLGEQLRLVEQTREVRAVIGTLETQLARTEAEHRAFLLTSESVHAQASETAGREAGLSFVRLRELVSDSPEQLRRLDQLDPLLAEQLALSDQIVRYAQTGRAYEGLLLVRSGRGAQLTRRIEQGVREVDAVQLERLRQQAGSVDRAARLNFAFSTVGTAVLLLVAAISGFLIWRYLATLARTQERLARANEELEARVEARTLDLSRAKDRAEAMLREVNHRVGNSLQLVSSFISLQSRRLDDEQARAAFQATQARIEAVSQVHRRLYTSDEVGQVALDDYLQALGEELRQSLCAEPGAPVIAVCAEPVVTDTDKAVAVGVLVAELTTNAVKYAYPKGKGGEIRVRLQGDEERAVLAVEDDGTGIGDGAPKGTGLGRTIVSAMARDLNSEVRYEPGQPGTRAVLEFTP